MPLIAECPQWNRTISEKMANLAYFVLLTVCVMAQGSPKMPHSEDPVIVVGGGLAGLSSSIEALRNGGKVILIEREKNVGGNSAKASSGIKGCGTEAQDRLGMKDSTDKLYSDSPLEIATMTERSSMFW
ncbi:hypothetical protein L596_015112 [Steinernema carpocapsae]|nr:hypothetical protein L596_015112 [Steinernema carpocapsae]